MLDESHEIVGDEEVGGGRDEDSIAVGGRNADTDGDLIATLCVPNNFLYGRLDTEPSGGMAPAYSLAPQPSLDRRRIGSTIAVKGVGRHVHVEEIDRWFK